MQILLAALLTLLAACCTSPNILEKVKVDRILRSSVGVKVAQVSEDGVGIGTGSGFVAAHSHGQTLVITAGHVCGSTNPLASQIMEIDGTTHEAEVALFDPRDVCILVSRGTWGQVAGLAHEDPFLGAPVIFAGATKGFWGPRQAVVTDARYSGTTNFDGVTMSVLSGMTSNGASGSGVFHQGQIIGIVVGVIGPASTPIMTIPYPTLREDLYKVLRQM